MTSMTSMTSTTSTTSTSSSSTGTAVCGDGVVEGDEVCDDGQNGDNDDACTDHCAAPTCGDELVQASLGEQCDEGAANADEAACTSTCKLATCGDGLVNASTFQLEQCDDANTVNDDGCSNACALHCCPDMLLLCGRFWLGLADGTWHDLPGGHPQYVSPGLAMLADGRGLAVYTHDDSLNYVTHADGVWTWASPVAPASATIPSVRAHTGGFHVAYQGLDLVEYYAHFDGTIWDPTAESITEGEALGTITTLADEAVYLFHDQGGALAVTTRSPVWQPPVVVDADGGDSRPNLITMTGGAELLAADGDRYYVREAGQWSPAGVLAGDIPPGRTPALVALPAGRAAAAWRTAEDIVEVAFYDLATDAWTAPTPIGNSEGWPAIAAGTGGADVVVAHGSLPPGVDVVIETLVDDAWTDLAFGNGGGDPSFAALTSRPSP